MLELALRVEIVEAVFLINIRRFCLKIKIAIISKGVTMPMHGRGGSCGCSRFHKLNFIHLVIFLSICILLPLHVALHNYISNQIINLHIILILIG